MSDGMTEMHLDLQAEYDRLDALRKQEGGNHYKNMKIQPVEFITANELGFLEGNVVKYVSRAGVKTHQPLEDLKKARWYLDREISKYE